MVLAPYMPQIGKFVYALTSAAPRIRVTVVILYDFEDDCHQGPPHRHTAIILGWSAYL